MDASFRWHDNREKPICATIPGVVALQYISDYDNLRLHSAKISTLLKTEDFYFALTYRRGVVSFTIVPPDIRAGTKGRPLRVARQSS